MERLDLRAFLNKVSPEERHALIVASGKYDILKFFDNLPWIRGAADWTAWRAFLAAVYALPMTPKELEIYQKATGRQAPPKVRAREVWVPSGRRARKSAIAAVIGLFEAVYRDHAAYLAPGERATIPILARHKRDARQIRDYVVAALASSPELSHLLDGEATAEEIHLTNRCDFEIRAASITSVRGRSVPLFIGDEIAFWQGDDYANPDREILRSVKPAQALVPNPMVIGLSSPYARRGILWEKYSQHWGKDGPILIWKADTLTMHDTPEIRAVVDEAYLQDPFDADAEYGANFRTDVVAFISEEQVAAISADHDVLPPEAGQRYVAFVDPSGGNSDSFTVGIAHYDDARGAVLDVLWEKEAPFDPTEAVIEATALIKDYGCTRVTGDRYGGATFQFLFKRGGVNYHVTDAHRSDLYRGLLPLINGKLCVFPTLQSPIGAKLRTQILALDRRVQASGRESIDHPKGAHDDLINAAAGALVLAERLRWEKKVEEVKPESTAEIFLDRVWSSVKKARGLRERKFVNAYARART
jgi:hypothetical protein